ncbi:Type IV fimbriae expression regulatory protein PilR [hydrothermal vent metagenome]|uniref:Type IV fimbriae expression regulatory protein PilR n=1 Tax=hydrothermal vent metagenome TaxID=652676 RepID=A0A3B1AAN5_9ZZZZ
MSNETQLILIVDDEPDIRELLEITLSRMGKETNSAKDIAQAKKRLAEQDYDLCLTDMRLPDGNGIELVKYINNEFPQLPVAMITAHGNMETAIEALKAGAFDFISKPVELKTLRHLINAALKLAPPIIANEQQSDETELKLLGASEAMQSTRKTIAKLARSQAPVYISGESGVGKELVARLIHNKGSRLEKPFVPVNCGAIPTELMESEFFGHQKGSFTGAVADKPGLFQAADGGTLFLDEVADLPLQMQVKLLRAIQEKAVRPIGGNDEIPINVRILSATHKNLADLVTNNQFRQDLFYRINVIELAVPSLRDRNEDVPVLIEHFLRLISAEWQVDIPHLTQEASEALANYPFPGNVRELENILERAMTMCENDEITYTDLHLPDINSSSDLNDILESTADLDIRNAELDLDESFSLDPAMNIKEREVITKALEKTRYNKTAAAKLLGITFRQLRYRIKKLGIE